ncbi:MAG: energy transducer TonB [Burkholderiales bacterium]|nr:energy transducer TonB [Bacteroidia bacterium]
MNILGNHSGKLNDIIFENRNKDYGAYAIRSDYNESLKKALLCLVGIVSLLFGSVIINNKINAISENDQPIIFEDPALKPLTYTTPVDLTPPKVEEPNHENSAAPKGTIGAVIIDNAIETNSMIIDNSVNGVGTASATGTDPVSINESTLSSIPSSVPSSSVDTGPVIVADDMPEFEGGVAGLMKYVGQNIVYPPVAREIGKEGTVYVSFVVNEFGNVESVKVIRGIGFGCDEEVMRVIGKMPRWKKIGKNAGHPVKVRFNIPVSFKLR